MRPLISWLNVLALISSVILGMNSGCNDKPYVLLVTGGHAFDTAEFYDLFLFKSEFSVDTIAHPFANKYIESKKAEKYDVVVFYDMWQEISTKQKNSYMELLAKGTGMVFLHHSLVSYQEWDEFTEIRGGKYRQPGYATDSSELSGYEHDIDLRVSVVDPAHPVTKGIQDFNIHDEGYFNIDILPTANPLLQTNHPSCARDIAWTNEYKNSRIVYIMLGHDRYAYENPSFRKLIHNSILWASTPN